VAVVTEGQIYTSGDSGTTWTPHDSNRDWAAVASSADGTKLVAAVNGGRIYTSSDSGATWTPRESGSVSWTEAVNEVLNSAAGTTTKTFTNGWEFVGTTDATRRQTLTGQKLDPVHSGIATFDLNLTGLTSNTVVLLVALIRAGAGAGNDIALTPATLEDLAMTSPNVAVRSVRIFP
jgi:hypothetical protein